MLWEVQRKVTLLKRKVPVREKSSFLTWLSLESFYGVGNLFCLVDHSLAKSNSINKSMESDCSCLLAELLQSVIKFVISECLVCPYTILSLSETCINRIHYFINQ